MIQIRRRRSLPSSLARVSFAAALACILAVFGGCKKEGDATGGDKSGTTGNALTIAVIPKGSTHEHWQRVKRGAEAAGKELGVNIIFKSPLKEDDTDQQVSLVQQFVSDNVSGIVLAPLHDEALLRPVQAAAKAKIPVVIMDSGIKGKLGEDYIAYVGTDNRHGGFVAGEALAKLLGGKGKVVMMRYMENTASTEEREAGFMDAMKKNPGIVMISESQHAGATAESATVMAENLLDKLREADGVYCPNESSTYGMLLALRKAGLLSKVRFVGFDTSPELLNAVRSGEIQGVVAQNPRKMGYEGVKTAVAKIKGTEFKTQNDTGAIFITKENLDSSEVKALFEK